MKTTHASNTVLFAPLLAIAACVLPDRDLGTLGTTSGEGSDSSGAGAPSVSATGASAESQGETTGEFPDDCVPVDVDPPSCLEDFDGDQVRVACDNAPAHFNPDQRDSDNDGIGDIADLCATIESMPSADSDGDGIGNACDSCPFPTTYYRGLVDGAPPTAGLQVRNIPDVGDLDGDGIGDACDNCVAVANCAGFGPDAPWKVGDPIERDDANACQRDDDADGIGDVCQGLVLPGAAGPVGFGPDDDFDQDGLANAVDGCARLPVAAVPCTDDGDCPDGSRCEPGPMASVCNHVDGDGDQIGDACDTCPGAVNGDQIADGAEAEDDEDGDFVGAACEAASECASRSDPRPTGFFPVSVAGQCCTVLLVEDDDGALLRADGMSALRTPDGAPIRRVCSPADQGAGLCAALPAAIAQAPGVLVAPAGCEEALGGAPASEQVPVSEADVGLDALWGYRCELPVFDQDFDGIGDACDLCPFSFDPTNEIYVDADGMVWPTHGKYCNGAYSIESLCGE